jgi:hypothetical protein
MNTALSEACFKCLGTSRFNLPDTGCIFKIVLPKKSSQLELKEKREKLATGLTVAASLFFFSNLLKYFS